MKATVEDIRNEMIDRGGEMAERLGFPRTAGMLKVLLWLTDGPLSLDEMASILEVSKASVSTNIRALERWKIVRRVYSRGDRKNYYEFRGDIWEIETEIARTLASELLGQLRDLLAHRREDLARAKPADREEGRARDFLDTRFARALEYVEAAEHFLGVLLKQGKVTPAVVKKIRIQ